MQPDEHLEALFTVSPSCPPERKASVQETLTLMKNHVTARKGMP